jgi:hypothetical protein
LSLRGITEPSAIGVAMPEKQRQSDPEFGEDPVGIVRETAKPIAVFRGGVW